MMQQAYVVGVDTHTVAHGAPVRMLYVAVEDTPEQALAAVRAKVSATCAIDERVAGTLSHETVLKLGLRPRQVRHL